MKSIRYQLQFLEKLKEFRIEIEGDITLRPDDLLRPLTSAISCWNLRVATIVRPV